jgi:drug/metabolite transporter (DMT)-like permease
VDPQLNNPIARGSLLAVGAAVLFGATTPVVQRFGENVGPFATASLLYAGAALASLSRRAAPGEAKLRLGHSPRVLLVALLGAVVAPSAFAWGLQQTSALATSLLLNLEAAFTVLLAFLIYREPIGRRVLAACALMLAGGVVLSSREDASGAASLMGLAAISLATLAWALDNTLTRPLADLDPRAVVLWKATAGAALSATIALFAGDGWPGGAATVVLLASGAAGYGVSLRLYLGAQRSMGAARTGSLFALAPFIGAGLSFAIGDRGGGGAILLSLLLFGLAAYLHVTEVHAHHHVHEAIEHDQVHAHDDGHHGHHHHPPVSGSHSHPHRHERLEHDHPHGSDAHHLHRHE